MSDKVIAGGGDGEFPMTNQNSPGNEAVAKNLWRDTHCGYSPKKDIETIKEALDAKDAKCNNALGVLATLNQAELTALSLAHKEEVEKLHHDLFVEQQYSSLQFDENRKLQGEVGALTKNLDEMGWAAKWRTSRDEQIIKLSSDLKMAVDFIKEVDVPDVLTITMHEQARILLSKLSVKEKGQ